MAPVEEVVFPDQEQEGCNQEVGLAKEQQADDCDQDSAQRADVAFLLHKLFKGQDNEQGRHHEIETLNLQVKGAAQEAAEKGPENPVEIIQCTNPNLHRGLIITSWNLQTVVDNKGLVRQAKPANRTGDTW